MQPYVQAYEVMMKCLIELLLENSGKKDDYKMNELPAKIRLMASSVRGKRPVIEHHQLLTLSLSQSSDLIKNLLLSLKSKGIVQVILIQVGDAQFVNLNVFSILNVYFS